MHLGRRWGSGPSSRYWALAVRILPMEPLAMDFDTRVKLAVYRHCATPTRHRHLCLRAIGGATRAPGRTRWPAAQRLGVPLPRPRREMVDGSRLHVKQHALLPVGRNGEGLVQCARRHPAPHRQHGPAVGARRAVVFHAPRAKRPSTRPGRDARDLRAPRPHRELLGSAGGYLRHLFPRNEIACHVEPAGEGRQRLLLRLGSSADILRGRTT